MKLIKMIAATAVTVIALASCQKEKNTDPVLDAAANTARSQQAAPLANSRRNSGFVYTLSNQTSGNMVLVYRRGADGSLTYSTAYAAGGNGTGGGLGNQGAVVIAGNNEGDEEEGDDDNNKVLLAVNAGSNTISSFKIAGGGLNLKSTVSSGGMRPISIAQYGNLVYVLNAGGTGNISGFRLGESGKLTPISNSTQPLSSNASGPAQVSFVRNGRVLVITEKATNKIITYTVSEAGRAATMHSINAASNTPFGFAAGNSGNIYVSEAVGGAPNGSNVSVYKIAYDGSIRLVQGPVATGQTAACWVVLTGNGRNIYTTNTASNTLSSYNVNTNSAQVALRQSIAATTNMGPIDAALSAGSKYLYVLNNGTHSITAYEVAANGDLTALPATTGLPVGANGLASE